MKRAELRNFSQSCAMKDLERNVDFEIRAITYMAIACSGMAVIACLLLLPVAHNQMSNWQQMVQSQLSSIKSYSDDTWNDMMTIRHELNYDRSKEEQFANIENERRARQAGNLPVQTSSEIREINPIPEPDILPQSPEAVIADHELTQPRRTQGVRQVDQQQSYSQQNPPQDSRANAPSVSHSTGRAPAQSQSYESRQPETCRGEPGPPGPPGPPGLDGEEGGPGTDGSSGVNAEPVRAAAADAPCITCPSGPSGPPGRAGPRGKDGLKGPPGTSGNPGTPGTQGLLGTKGDSGVPGKNGKMGVKGGPGNDKLGGKGQPGPKGLVGLPGQSGPYGPNGKHGYCGKPGIGPGPSGTPGPRGDDGPPGPPGIPGDAGGPGPDALYCPCPKKSVLEQTPGYRPVTEV